MLTRDAIAAAVRDARAKKTALDLSDGFIRTVSEDRVRAAPTDEDVEKVKEQLGNDAAAGRLVPFTISTERRAADGHVVKAAGWQLDRYRKNPVVLWSHDRWSPRIADSIVEVVDNRLRAVAAFFPRELSPLSWEIGEIAASRGYACSVGFRILRASPAPDDVVENIPWALDVEAARLDEWSPCNIGADEDALTESRTAGLSTDAIAAALSRALDEGGIAAMVRSEVERLYRAAAPAAPVVSLPSLSDLDASQKALRQLLQG